MFDYTIILNLEFVLSAYWNENFYTGLIIQPEEAEKCFNCLTEFVCSKTMTKYDSANPVNAYIFFDTVDENGNPESQTLSPEIFYNEAPDLEVTDDTVRLIVFLSRVIGLAELREIHFGVSTPDGQPTPAEITLILEDGDEFDVSKSHPYNIRHQSITYCLNHTFNRCLV